MTIPLHEAVKIARTQAQQLFEEQDLPHLALEEVDFDEAAQAWLITLGYDSHQVIKTIQDNFTGFGGNVIEEKKPRKYKIFRIDATDGRLLAVKIRNV